MVQILFAIAGILLAAALISWLIKRSLERQRREREILRGRPDPDFSFLEEGDELPMAQIIDDEDDCLPTFDVELEPAPEEAVEYTGVVEPLPIFGTRASVRQALTRAMRYMERCSDAHDRLEFGEAEAFARAALRQFEHMKLDHWYRPRVLCWLGYLRYEQGFSYEAKELWEQAEQGAIEWFEQCQDILPTIRENLDVFHNNF